jgi:hypothetical protein
MLHWLSTGTTLPFTSPVTLFSKTSFGQIGRFRMNATVLVSLVNNLRL